MSSQGGIGMSIKGIPEALAYYKVCAKSEGLSPKTIEWITSSVRYFSDFLGDVSLYEITAFDLRRFIIALQEKAAYSNHPCVSTQNRVLSAESVCTYVRAIKSFFSFLSREEVIPTNPMAKVKLPKRPQKNVPTFSEAEIQKLLSQPDRRTPVGFRDYIILLVFVDTAVRLSELAGLKVGDIDFDTNMLRVMGKGQKERWVPFGRKAGKALMKYIMQYRQKSDSEGLWLKTDGDPLPSGRIERIVTLYGKKAGLSRCYCHKLRHTSAVMFVRNEGESFVLQKKLGHSTLAMTRSYCELADADVRDSHLKHSPADRLKV